MLAAVTEKIESIAFINNPISARMLSGAIRHEQLDPTKMVLFVLRPLKAEPWWAECARTVVYPAKASLSVSGQLKFVPFYLQASRVLAAALQSVHLKRIIVVNNDNILTNHAISAARYKPDCRVIVISEGLMNYQDIRLSNRAKWRNQLRPVVARTLGLQWNTPTGHLSGAFEDQVSHVYSFSESGLFAPTEKIQVLPLEPVTSKVPPEPETVLFLETALWQWMDGLQFQKFSDAFAKWLNQLGLRRLLIKPHPNYPPSQYLRSIIPKYEIAYESDSVENVAESISATRVVGFCCTGLITLAILRPELQCIDFGHDFYLKHAYRGDDSLLKLMESVGVQLVRYDCQDGETKC